MRTCPTCAREAPLDMDFCECGEYLRWEPTGCTPVVERAPAVGPSAGVATPLQSPAASAAQVQMTLFSPTGDWLSTPTLSVEPGGSASFTARVRNQRGIVDHFAIRLEGMPSSWWTVAPAAVFLTPYGSDGACEDNVTVTLHPPRSSDAEAREWPVRVVASSQSAEADMARVAATVTIGRFDELEVEPWPQRRERRWRARYRMRIRNAGNATSRLTLGARDDGDRCRFRIASSQLEIPPGQTVERSVTARPKRPIVVGRPADHQLELTTRRVDDIDTPPSTHVAFRQRPWLSRWTMMVVPLLVLAAAALLLLRARVPDVRGMRVDAAERRLDTSHLGWKPFQFKPSHEPSGTVLATIPPGGVWRLRGAQVTLIVATSDAKATVPDVRGKRYADAVVALANAGFKTTASPPRDGRDPLVADQVPAAGEQSPRNRPVALTLIADHAKRKQRPARKPRPAARVKLPAVAGLPAAQAMLALRTAGLEPRETDEISRSPAGTVLGTRPTGGTLARGGAIELRVSAGIPQVAYDDGHAIFVADGRGGRHARRVQLAGDGDQTQPAWTSDGLRLVYRSGSEDEGRIWLSSATTSEHATPTGGRPLTSAGHDDRRPTLSPDGKLIAFARGPAKAETHRLCFVMLAAANHRASCVRDAGVSVSRPVWSPAGTTILAPTGTGKLLRFTSRDPSSTTSWHSRGMLATAQLGAVQFAAWSVHGTLAIAVIPAPGERATLYLAHGTGLARLAALPFAGIACEVAWRPDGDELVVTGRTDAENAACPDVADGPDKGAAVRLTPDGSSSEPFAVGIVNPAFRPLAGGG